MTLLITAADHDAVGKVYEFGLILSVAGAMPPNMLDYFEKPWKWEPEYQKWRKAGKPYPPEATDYPIQGPKSAALAWDTFIASLEDEDE